MAATSVSPQFIVCLSLLFFLESTQVNDSAYTHIHTTHTHTLEGVLFPQLVIFV